jgi:glucose-1-phosphate cytidylyltransferase
MTYGDGLSNVDIAEAIRFHNAQKSLATITAVSPPGRFGMLTLEDRLITGFREKPPGDGARINGGFFVLSPKVFDYIDGDTTSWEREPLERLAGERQLSAFMHDGFWQPMDHLRDKVLLEELWSSGSAPWKVWE